MPCSKTTALLTGVSRKYDLDLDLVKKCVKELSRQSRGKWSQTRILKDLLQSENETGDGPRGSMSFPSMSADESDDREASLFPDYEYEKYLATPKTVNKVIRRYGVAIIPNILDRDELKAFRKGGWETITHLTEGGDTPPFQLKKESTWKSFYDLVPMHSMMFQHYGIGHAQYVWNLRQNPKIIDVFARIYKVDPEDLIVSFDGVSIHLPPEKTGKGWFKNPWWHADQSLDRPEYECVQGWVTAYDVDDGDATLRILEKSNRVFEKLAALQNDRGRADADAPLATSKGDWVKVEGQLLQWYLDQGCVSKAIKCPAGSMVLWDSRTVHFGQEAREGRPHENYRSVVYICMQPREFATEAELKKKQKIFNERRMTSHWPRASKMFPKNPNTWGRKLPTINPLSDPELSEIGLRLAGF